MDNKKQINDLVSRIPLLHHLLNDPYIKIVQRAVDNEWVYQNVLSNKMSGFNPSHRAIYISYQSNLGHWLRRVKQSRFKDTHRILNMEILFLIHDYLHCWGYLMIQELLPKLRFGFGKINKKNAESYVFCHLLTEAIATVGLDYWYLCTLSPNKLRNLGLNYIGLKYRGLSVTYHECNLRNHQKFNKNFTAQRVKMFGDIASFYCSGSFPYFSMRNIEKSSSLKKWLSHEFDYGKKQRIFTREWISYLSEKKVEFNKNKLDKPVLINKAWQRKLIAEIGEKLWDLIKHNKQHEFQNIQKKIRSWKRIKMKTPDFRFTNLNKLNKKYIKLIKKDLNYEENFWFFCQQYLSNFTYNNTPKKFIDHFGKLNAKRLFGKMKPKDMDDFLKLGASFQLKKCKGPRSEPIDLFFLS